ncbi:MAG TPA: hypothetical protein VKY74_23290 [Chloroflexia bacterium]|nr:hypothetical protein [Chloroflexia bacterium]
MIGYYVLAFDGQLFETTLYPAVWRAYYLNDYSALERLAADYPLLQRYVRYSQEWTRKGCRRPLKHFSTGICEFNTKSAGIARLHPPDAAASLTDAWSAVIAVLERKGRCTLIDVPCGQNRLIHSDLIDLCRYKTAGGASWELGTPAQREFVHRPLADAHYANFVDLVASALANAVAVPHDALQLLTKLSSAFRGDLELHYTGDQTGFLGYLTPPEAAYLHQELAAIAVGDLQAHQYLECLRGFLADARDHGSGLVLEVA